MLIEKYSAINEPALEEPEEVNQEQSLALMDRSKIIETTLYTLHKKDRIVSQKSALTNKKAETQVNPQPEAQSLFSKVLNWFKANDKKPLSNADSTGLDDEKQLVDSTPELDPPENLPSFLKNTKLPPLARKEQIVDDQKIIEILKMMSEKTMHEVMGIVMKAQAEIEHEGALLTYDNLLLFQKQQKIQQKALEEVTKALLKDEKIASYFSKIQDIALIAAAATTILVATGLTGGIAGFAVAIFGPTIGAAISTALAVLPYIGGVVGAVSAGAKGYFQVRADEESKTMKVYQHNHKVHERVINDWHSYVQGWSTSKNDTEKNLNQLVQNIMKMAEMINASNK